MALSPAQLLAKESGITLNQTMKTQQ